MHDADDGSDSRKESDGHDAAGADTTAEKSKEQRPLKLRILRAVPVVVVLGLLVHFVLPRVGAIEDSFQTLKTMVPWAIALAVLAQVLSYLANGSVLQSVIRLAKEKMSLRRAVAIELGAGTVSLVAAGALGFGAAIYKWTRNGGASADVAMLASWLPSVFDAATLILFAMFSAVELLRAHQLGHTTVVALVIVVSFLGVVIAGVIVLLAREQWMLALAKRLARIIKRFHKSADESVVIDAAERAASAWRHMRSGGWLRPVASSFFVLAFDLLCLELVFVAAGQRIHPALLIAGYGVPMLLGRSSFLPGGIAVIEVAMSALYGGLGIPANVAVVVVLIYRLISFWLPAIIGIPFAIALQSQRSEASD